MPEDPSEPEVVVTPPAPSPEVEVEVKGNTPAPQPQADDKIDKMAKRLEYQARQAEKQAREFEKAMRQIQELAAKLPAAPEPTPVPEDEIDRIAQTDWKQGVKRVVLPEVEKTLNELLEKRERERAEAAVKTTQETLKQKSIQSVLEAHPEIEDDNSDFSRAYTEVLNEDQSLLGNPLGPEIAMHRAEKRLSPGGAKIKSGDSDVSRVERVRVSTPAPSRAPQGNRIVLTTEEKKICDSKGINYEDYIKFRGTTGQQYREGVSVDD